MTDRLHLAWTTRPDEWLWMSNALIYASAALVGAGMIHGLYRLAEALERRKRVGSRDLVMLPGLIGLACLLALGADWLDTNQPDLLPGIGFATFLGMRIGQVLPRPPRRQH